MVEHQSRCAIWQGWCATSPRGNASSPREVTWTLKWPGE